MYFDEVFMLSQVKSAHGYVKHLISLCLFTCFWDLAVFLWRNYGGHPVCFTVSPNLKLGSDILIAGPIHLWCLCDPVITSHD